LLSGGGGSGSAAAGEPAFPVATRTALEDALTKTMAANSIPGVVVGIWIPGEGTWITTRGVSDLVTKTPMRADDHFRIGSNTKTFTVTALLQLADEKKLGLDDPVSRYLDFVPNGENITLRMLANMTSGLVSYTEDDAWVKEIFSHPERVWTPRELVDVGFKHPPHFVPGKGWNYSNTNAVLLGMIVEKVTGKKIQEVFGERIFTPLRLRHTVWPTTGEMPRPYSHGYTEQTLDGKRADATDRNPSWAFSAGQLISTLADLKIWAKALATGTLLSPEMQRERLTWVTLPPNTPTRHYGLGIGEDNGWLGHTGELPGYNTAVYYLPEKDATLLVLVNSDIPTDGIDPAPAVFKALARVITPDHVPQ
jgi:D-alanyl-D-alanine carboxypeptidase